jgi:thioredoxin 1
MKNNPKFFRISGIMILTTLLCVILMMSVVAADTAATKKTPSPAKSDIKPTSIPQNLPRLVDIGADKCVPCVAMAPILEDLKKEYTGILDVKFVDAWKYPEEAQKYQVRGIPTQIFYDTSGKELGRHMGFIDKEGILKGFEHFGVTIKKPAGNQTN